MSKHEFEDQKQIEDGVPKILKIKIEELIDVYKLRKSIGKIKTGPFHLPSLTRRVVWIECEMNLKAISLTLLTFLPKTIQIWLGGGTKLNAIAYY